MTKKQQAWINIHACCFLLLQIGTHARHVVVFKINDIMCQLCELPGAGFAALIERSCGVDDTHDRSVDHHFGDITIGAVTQGVHVNTSFRRDFLKSRNFFRRFSLLE